MTSKLKTNLAAIDNCAGKVKGLAGKADGMRGKLSAAEVPDDAWGLIGQLVVGEYRSLLADFRDFLNRMAEGTGHAGDRLGESAVAYREADESSQQAARQLKSRLGGSK